MALYLPDANVLIHALRKESKEHESCRRWLTDAAAVGTRSDSVNWWKQRC